MWPFKGKSSDSIPAKAAQNPVNALVWDEQNRLFLDNQLMAQVVERNGIFKIIDKGLPSPEWLGSGYRTLESAKAEAEYAAFD